MRNFDDGDTLFGPEVTAVFRDALAQATCILSGCAPSSGGGLTVDVASGTAAINAVEVSVGAASPTLAARDTFDRLDLVTVDSGGSVNTTTGSSELKCPSIPTDEALVSVVRVPSSSDGGAITVYDSRVLTSSPHFDVAIATTLSADTVNADDVIAFDELDIPVVTSDVATVGALFYRSDLD